MMRSCLAARNLSQPCCAMTAGSVSLCEPKNGMPVLLAFCFSWSNAPACAQGRVTF